LAYDYRTKDYPFEVILYEKLVTISLTSEQQENARRLSKELFGKENISGYIGYLINVEVKKSVGKKYIVYNGTQI